MNFESYFASYKVDFPGPKSSLEKNNSKNAIFPMTKDLGLLLLILSKVTSLKERFIRLHKVF